MSKNHTTTQSRIRTPEVTPSSKAQSSRITDWFQATPPVTQHHQATNSLSSTPNNTHHHEKLISGLEVVSNNVLHSDTQLLTNKTNHPPNLSNNHCQEKYGIKIIVNNIAGLGISIGKMDYILRWLTTKKVDILLGQEANVSFPHPKIQSYFRGRQCSQIHITSSETEWVYQQPYKPGGTFCLSTQQIQSRFLSRIPDQAGRWSGTVYQFKGGVKIAAISIYQAPNTAPKGITSIYSQQNAWLRKNRRKEDPRTALYTDIKETLQNLQKENVLIITGGDFNDSNKFKGLHHVLSAELGLQDAWGSQPAPGKFIRGTECIDHVYVSHDLHQCIQSVNYLPFYLTPLLSYTSNY
jgi:exonuclease III